MGLKALYFMFDSMEGYEALGVFETDEQKNYLLDQAMKCFHVREPEVSVWQRARHKEEDYEIGQYMYDRGQAL